jgi:hypothetical protein
MRISGTSNAYLYYRTVQIVIIIYAPCAKNEIGDKRPPSGKVSRFSVGPVTMTVIPPCAKKELYPSTMRETAQ